MSDAAVAKRTVLVAAFLLAAIAVYKNRSTGETFKALWGVSVVSLVLSVVADFAPAVAGPFAILVVLGSLTHGGDTLIQKALGKAAAPAPTTSPAVRQAPPHGVTVPSTPTQGAAR